MNRIDRLFGIIVLLQSKKFVPAEKIAEKFNISIRTVYRDIKTLCSQGVPISFEQYKGYFVVQGYFLPPVAFSTEEANALLLMETMVYGFADKSIQTHYSTALTKVKNVLRHQQKEKLELLSNHIKMQLPPCFSIGVDCLSALQDAIAAKTLIQIEYLNKNNESSSRRAEPIGLVFYALNWHLIAWCHNRQTYRDFRLSRIVNINCLSDSFTKKDHLSLDEYVRLLPVSY